MISRTSDCKSSIKMIERLLLAIALLAVCPAISSSSNSAVRTETGLIYGHDRKFNTLTLTEYLGIPFGQPPIGNLRFKRTVPAKPWTSPLYANYQPPACVQYTKKPFPWRDDLPGQSEDCLYLNIWVPPNTTPFSRKPVVFWVYGGGYFLGSNRLEMYDGAALSTIGDVIVVSANFRVGVLGLFFSDLRDAPGNVAIYDIVESLKWVNKNINHFGGDNRRITVYGVSTGGMAVGLLTISPLSRNLFQYAVMGSGSPAATLSGRNQLSERSSQAVAKAVRCSSDYYTLKDHPREVISCMRKRSAIELVKAESLISSDNPIFFPHFGDELLPIDPLQAVLNGDLKPTNLLIGNVGDEGSVFLTSQNPQVFGFYGQKNTLVNKSFVKNFINTTYAGIPNANEIIDYYVSPDRNKNLFDLRYNAYTALGDKILLCPDEYFAEKFAEKGNAYFYYFTHRPSNCEWAPWMGYAHYQDIKFTFGLPFLFSYEYTDIERQLSKAMIKFLTDFAKTGVPHANWPKYSRRNHAFIYLDTTERFGKAGYGPHEQNCNFLRTYLGF